MLFLTFWFVFFASICYPAYWLCASARLRRPLLMVFCAVFHTYFAGPAGVVPILILGLVTYLCGLSRNRTACAAGIILSVLALVFYKYTRFLCLDVLTVVWPHAGFGLFKHTLPFLPGAPPLAVSFFVFEFVHYLYDVRRGSEPIRNPLDFSLFALFWPSIVAGPVKRYEQFLPALNDGLRRTSRHDVAYGMLLVAIGLVKKLVADTLTAYLAWHENKASHEGIGLCSDLPH